MHGSVTQVMLARIENYDAEKPLATRVTKERCATLVCAPVANSLCLLLKLCRLSREALDALRNWRMRREEIPEVHA